MQIITETDAPIKTICQTCPINSDPYLRKYSKAVQISYKKNAWYDKLINIQTLLKTVNLGIVFSLSTENEIIAKSFRIFQIGEIECQTFFL